MSFILEALKKSEQQRQQQHAPQQQVRKRTLSLQANRSARCLLPWLLAGLLPVVLLGGWWLFSQTDATLMSSSAVDRATASPAPSSQAVASEPAEAAPPAPGVTQAPAVTPSSTNEPQQPVMAAEPAPIPRSLGVSPSAPARASTPKSDAAPAQQRQAGAAPLETVIIQQPEPQAHNASALEPAAAGLPRYAEMSRELRDRLPPVNMSMHFYNKDPDRRLVRINDRLLHEGDWVDRDLQLVEITKTGAILEFMGKSFELRSARR